MERKLQSWLLILMAAAVLLTAVVPVMAQTPVTKPAQASACSAAAYRQFDFWLGDWDVFDVGGTSRVARVRVTPILDGCVVHEEYREDNGYQGQSFSIYDSSRDVWQQTWMTNRGRLLLIEGKLQADEMVLAGSYYSERGEQTLVRGTWKPGSDGVRETAVTSIDAGKSWKPWFDLNFRPHPREDDAKALATLDTEYQAAVKRNDAATMDRILADDFVLVTGSGKTYNKADLLEEARSGRMKYQHQEDTNQTVRLWGDTAVVTAKLWEKGTQGGKPFDYIVWFSDTYVRTANGWKYVLGQSSLPPSQ